ncbi:Excalibur calcium-binding domain-containing protein [Planococcus glaciei]|uniref:Excalibur calcium-binding domain-containing protein n=2 Tax=Planococcus glaciei TaxID=459472 RepID=A0A1G8G1A4_9BACL|nr:excalibur calcium-binding domain-containing protein [Planococcus glaciei]QDY44855.1 excalibur calcium-binding domain-containing protein [Planococcus glaciei]QKX49571.1 excalibur calcium-binding domain-containing protein [Planococcus glaciei]SDH88171.1 Excalibur calcium-binding domain-containing protein [Planococcus glaciei]
MKKLSFAVMSLMVALSFTFSAAPMPADAAGTKAKTYKNCTEINKVYAGGIARSSKVKNKGGKTKYKPFVSQALYDANKKSDRDKDLIACER